MWDREIEYIYLQHYFMPENRIAGKGAMLPQEDRKDLGRM
jgi:hypothetical protein